MKIYQIVGITGGFNFEDKETIMITEDYEKAKDVLSKSYEYAKLNLKNVDVKMYVWESGNLIFTVNPDL